jgi:hypothetical protein
MKNESIKVVIVPPNQKAQVAEIDQSLDSIQQIIGGCPQFLCPFDDPVFLICNEDRHMIELPFCRLIESQDCATAITGTFIIAAIGDGINKFTSLPEEFADKYNNKFLFPEKLMQDGRGGSLKSVKYEVFF